MTSPRRFNICTKAAKCAILAFLILRQRNLRCCNRACLSPRRPTVEISPVHQPLLLDGTLDQLQQLRIRPMAGHVLAAVSCLMMRLISRCAELSVIAQELNASSIEQVVYAWILRLPSQPLPIIGSGKIERVRAALEAETLSLTRQQWFRIRKAALGYDVP